jgi:dTDP-4-amino-4,6-dideoxygalactose transaminase
MTHSSLLSLFSLLKLLDPRKIDGDRVSKYWHKEQEVAIFLSKTAWSIALLSLIRKSQKNGEKVIVWIPDYFCNASLNILRETACEIVFYPILENLEPDFSSFKEMVQSSGSPDIFLLVHYFGKPTSVSRSVEFCSNNGAWLVEDAAHVLRPVKGIGEAGDFVLYSPHKLLPLPNGAILIARPDGPTRLEPQMLEDIFKKRKWIEFLSELKVSSKGRIIFKGNSSVIIWVLKQILQKVYFRRYIKQAFYETEQSPPENFAYPKPEINRISLKILSGLCHKLADIASLRERNQMLWDYCMSLLSQKGNKAIHPGTRPTYLNWTPYLSSYAGEEQTIAEFYNNLKAKKFLPTTWPDLPPELFVNKTRHNVAIRLRNSGFYLPVHQSVSRNHFRSLIKEASKFSETNKSNIRVEWNKSNKAEWDSLIISIGKSNLLQSWSYGESKSKVEGWIVNRVIWYQDDKIVAFAQVLEKRIAKLFRVYRVNRGPLFISSDAYIKKTVIHQLLAFGNIFSGKILSVSLELEKNPEDFACLSQTNLIVPDPKGYSSIWMDLRLPLDIIRKSLNGKWRNMLVFAEKQELQVESGSSQNLIDWVCDIHNENMKGKGFKGISPEFLKSLALEEDTDNPVVVYKATSQGVAVAAVCVAYHGNAATYLIGWTSDEGRRLKANYLLLWEAIKELQCRKKEWFDLGGIDPEATPGITGFKTGMNGELYAIVPAGWSIK